MPKPIFNLNQEQNIQIDINLSKKNASKIDERVLKERLRKKRSSKYIEAIKSLDVGDVKMSEKEKNELLDIVKEEFSDVSLNIVDEASLVGILAKCYLGHPYEVHTLSFMGFIIKHYTINEELPKGFEVGRALCLHPQYEFIEIYDNFIVGVYIDGSTSIVQNKK